MDHHSSLLKTISLLFFSVLILGRIERLTAEPSSLPEPLTLEYALSLSDEPGADLQYADAQWAKARAEQQIAGAETGVKVSIEGRLRWIEPSWIAYDKGPDDHKISLVVRKNLYDFGRSTGRLAAAAEYSRSYEWLYQNSRLQRRIIIMERYFDVLLADLEAARDEEAMAVAFVALDKLRNRHELGQVSDVELMELESLYQNSRRRRTVSQNQQRAARSRLAIILNRPAALPAELTMPALQQAERELPGYEKLFNKAIRDNPLLQARRAEVESARKSLDVAKAGSRPMLEAVLEASDYSRVMGSYDDWRAGVEFAIPLYTSGSLDASVAKEQARLYESQARLSEAEDTVRQAVLDLWLKLQELKVQRDEMAAIKDYRDLYLDHSRARYEMEVQTDLGDAMVRLSEAELGRKRTDFQIALAWERLDALTGGPVESASTKSSPENQQPPTENTDEKSGGIND